VVINNLDLKGVAVAPPKTDPPLVVDTNAMLAGAIAFELLQAVTGRDAEVFELLGGVHDAELPEHESV
jgi:hypothetical protein